jgi:hypothetical protein
MMYIFLRDPALSLWVGFLFEPLKESLCAP